MLAGHRRNWLVAGAFLLLWTTTGDCQSDEGENSNHQILQPIEEETQEETGTVTSAVYPSVTASDYAEVESIMKVSSEEPNEQEQVTQATQVSKGTRDACLLPADPGPCTAEQVHFFYDIKMQRCRQFIYGGCEGNANNFPSEDECVETCTATTSLTSHHQSNSEENTIIKASSSEGDSTQAVDGIIRKEVEDMLTLNNGNGETSFTFSAEYPFIQLKAENIIEFNIRQTREIVFEFRSPEAQGLLLYHTLRNPPIEEPKYELYVLLEGGELKTVHVFGANETTVLVGKGLNRDRWHRVSIRVDPTLATLQIQVDDETQTSMIEGIDKDEEYARRLQINSTFFIGGMNWLQDGIESSYLFEHFVGCLRNFQLKTGPDFTPLKPLKAYAYRDIVKGCVDKCKAGENRCRNGGRCLNHYSSTACDCFGTRYEGDSCDYDNPTTITLRGYSYVSYRIYDWKDRAHSESNRISLRFRALMGDSILFYAGGTFPYENHIAVTLLANGSLYVDVDFGDGPHGVCLGQELTTGAWNNFTLIHEGNSLEFILNGRSLKRMVEGPRHYLRFDPHIFVGGDRKPLGLGLRSSNNFVGCLSEVYFNEDSILQKLRTNSQQTLYHSIFRPEIGKCNDVPVVPITFPFQESNLVIDLQTIPHVESQIDISFDFKTRNATAILAHGTGNTPDGNTGLWELRLTKGVMEFRVSDDAANESVSVVIMSKGQRLADGSWHQVRWVYTSNEASLTVDYGRPESIHFTTAPPLVLEENPLIIIGTGYLDSQPGFVGCVRDLTANRKKLDPRVLISTAQVREISLDNCQLVDPCLRPNACEHGGLCNVDEGRVVCDCTGTGYTGKNCHFALYKRTCEELALLGYMKSGVYEIDIDGNGPHPPAHVRCEFEANSGVRKTVVEHNLPRDMEIRSQTTGDIVFNLTYREFSADMLQSLISQSLQCKQILRYDCYRAPLELHSYTWFRSAAGNLLDYVGKALPGRCPCSVNRDCKHNNVFCNCDADEPRWLLDEGYLTQPEDLGITQIFALQQRNLVPQAEGRITLGPLECVEANTQQYVVTFKSPDSYMEVPGWHRGDLAFSFRTSSEKAILLYQPLLHPKHPYFRVILVNDHKLVLEFSINGEPRSVAVKSSRDLNSGEWQQVWIDYNEYHVRFTVNQESILVDLKDGEEFGPFEATLFIGGAPEEMLDSDLSVHTSGLVGCFRGLVMNNEVVNLYAYMNARFPDMIQKHCRPSCDPNPCKNGATCAEFWGSYKCMCENPMAHFGYNCETDINQNALTFRTSSAFVEANATTMSIASTLGLGGFFKEDILINIRTFDIRSLVFYAYDYHNNFVQLHIEDSSRVVFTFNSGNTIYDVSATVEDLATGKSTQIFLDREPDFTTLHVNGVNSTVQAPLRLVERYARDPWINKEKEMIKPPRPVRRPEEFYQVFLGGVDVDYMMTDLKGYTGCLRGLSVGGHILDLTSKGADGIARDDKEWVPVGKAFLIPRWTTRSLIFHSEDGNIDHHSIQARECAVGKFIIRTRNTTSGGLDLFESTFYDIGEESGVMHNCNMLCDQLPCLNGGTCLEDFQSNTYRCDCELTSYSGPSCTEEKGAHFRGGSYITAHYAPLDLDVIKIHLAFSTTAVRNIAQALLLIQTSAAKSKYLLVSLTSLGYLRIEDDRGTGIVYGAEVKAVNFLNGARHSVYYRRNGPNTLLLVDKDEVPLRPLSTSIHPDSLTEVLDQNAIHIGGVQATNDPRFADYDHFDGCISNVVVELDGNQLHPLLAYLGYQKSGLEAVTSHDPEGIEEEARCAAFSITPPGVIEDVMDSDNDTSDQDWIPKPPLILPYKPVFVGPTKYDSTISNRILVGLGCIFLAGLIALILYLCKTRRRSRRRQYQSDDEQLLIVPTPKSALRPSGIRTGVPSSSAINPLRTTGGTAATKAHGSTGLQNASGYKILKNSSSPAMIVSSTSPMKSDVIVDLLNSIENEGSESCQPEGNTSSSVYDDSGSLEKLEASLLAVPLEESPDLASRPNTDIEESLDQLNKMKEYLASIEGQNELLKTDLSSIPPSELEKVIDLMKSLAQKDGNLLQEAAPGEDESASSLLNLVESMPLAIEMVTNVLLTARNMLDNSKEDVVDGNEIEMDNQINPSSCYKSDEGNDEENQDGQKKRSGNEERRRAPMGHISEVFLSDDEELPPFSYKGLEDMREAERLEEPSQAAAVDRRVTSTTARPYHPSPVYVAENVRTFSNPLSYLGGPRLLTENLQRSSKESVLSIDE